MGDGSNPSHHKRKRLLWPDSIPSPKDLHLSLSKPHPGRGANTTKTNRQKAQVDGDHIQGRSSCGPGRTHVYLVVETRICNPSFWGLSLSVLVVCSDSDTHMHGGGVSALQRQPALGARHLQPTGRRENSNSPLRWSSPDSTTLPPCVGQKGLERWTPV